MTQPLIAQEYYEQIVNKFKKYNSYDSNHKFEFRIERIAHNGFVLVYTDTTTQFQFEQTFWYSTFDERPLSTQISLTLGFYDLKKRVIKSLCNLYPELKEKIWLFSTGYRNKNGDFTEHMNLSTDLTEQEFHNDVQLRITPWELIVSVDTVIPKEQADSIIKQQTKSDAPHLLTIDEAFASLDNDQTIFILERIHDVSDLFIATVPSGGGLPMAPNTTRIDTIHLRKQNINGQTITQSDKLIMTEEYLNEM